MKKIISFCWVPFVFAASHARTPAIMQTHWGIDFNVGWSSMTNAPTNATPDYDTLFMNPGVQPEPGDTKLGDFDWLTYNPQWSTLKPRGGRSGSVLRGGLSYLYVHKTKGIGLGAYVVCGYNNARSSSFFQPFGGEAKGSAMNRNDGELIYLGSLTGTTKSSLMPESKVTVAASTNIEAGVRVGMVPASGRCFPYVKAGWGMYRVKGVINAVWSPSVGQYFGAKQDRTEQDPIGTIYAQGAKGDGAGTQFDSHVYSRGSNTLQNLWPTQMETASSGAQWVNAGVVGVGLDFAPYHRVGVGFSYQVAFCNPVTFKKWDVPVAGGIQVVSQTGSSDTGNPTNAQSWYNIATAFNTEPSVTIRPVFQSVMMSLRYVFPV